MQQVAVLALERASRKVEDISVSIGHYKRLRRLSDCVYFTNLGKDISDALNAYDDVCRVLDGSNDPEIRQRAQTTIGLFNDVIVFFNDLTHYAKPGPAA